MQNSRLERRPSGWNAITRLIEGPLGWTITLVVIPVLIVAVLLLPPINLLDRLQLFTYTRISTSGGAVADPDGATISFPTNGQSFNNIPITVQGICPADLLVKIFKNEVFSGAVFCEGNGTFSLEIDLFSGRNELVARVYDALDQPGPDSNKPVVTYNDAGTRTPIDQLVITSNFALRGADPFRGEPISGQYAWSYRRFDAAC